ncbi:MAG: hypothetical protein Q4G16_03805 [Cruoricaptor ignavus]|nr:hypothetical protein [Cruoricaptor ignavus]
MQNNFSIKYIVLAIAFISLAIACKKDNLSLEQVKYNNNQSTYPTTKMDSTQAINSITKQKVTEVLELSILFNSGNQDTEIDSALFNQISGYFYKPDSTTLQNLFSELDSLKVANAKINNFELKEQYFKKDTLNFAKFNVEYFDKNNSSIGNYEREAQYILIPAEIKFKKEFKFYFLNFYNKPLNDSILSETIK